jgi:hypothetical protein
MDGQDELSCHFDAVRARRSGLPSVYQLSRNRNYAVAKFLPPPYEIHINAEPNEQFPLPIVNPSFSTSAAHPKRGFSTVAAPAGHDNRAQNQNQMPELRVHNNPRTWGCARRLQLRGRRGPGTWKLSCSCAPRGARPRAAVGCARTP